MNSHYQMGKALFRVKTSLTDIPPRRPLEKQEIADTIEGIIRLVGIIKRLRDKRTIREHIWHFKTILKRSAHRFPAWHMPIPWMPGWRMRNTWTCPLFTHCSVSYRISQGPVLSLTWIRLYRWHLLISLVPFVMFCRKSQAMYLPMLQESFLQEFVKSLISTILMFLVSLNEGHIPRLTTRLPFTNSSENSRMDTRTSLIFSDRKIPVYYCTRSRNDPSLPELVWTQGWTDRLVIGLHRLSQIIYASPWMGTWFRWGWLFRVSWRYGGILLCRSLYP